MRKRQADNTVWRFFFLSEADWHSLAQPFINFFSPIIEVSSNSPKIRVLCLPFEKFVGCVWLRADMKKWLNHWD